MNNLMNMNPMQMMQQFEQFRKGFSGDPQQTVMRMVQSGKISQQQLNMAQQMAPTIMQMLGKR